MGKKDFHRNKNNNINKIRWGIFYQPNKVHIFKNRNSPKLHIITVLTTNEFYPLFLTMLVISLDYMLVISFDYMNLERTELPFIKNSLKKTLNNQEYPPSF